ncbi:MAG: hypothetical protein IPK87_12560 [Planctomycetes bacterium]|nr:hypothetical protein [Planctomycetota bacterium]
MAEVKRSHADALAARLNELAAQHSLSEIARRTGSSRNNVSRYARGAKMPLEFGSALVEGLGINPAWLLTGEGTPRLAEASVQTTQMAGNLLELVEAMNAVAHMRMGALTGKHHLRVLRELNDALARYEKLRDELNRHTRGIYSDLLDQYHEALDNGRLEQAEDLRRALAQVSRLSEDRGLRLRLLEEQAHHAYWQRDHKRTIGLLNALLFETIAQGEAPPERICELAHNLAMALLHEFSMEGALRICESALALVGKAALELPSGRLLDGLSGVLLVELGQVESGLSRLQRHIAWRSEIYLGISSGLLVRALLLAGVVDFAMAQGIGEPGQGKSSRLVLFANWLEQPEPLRSVLKHAVGSGIERTSPEGPSARYAAALLDVLTRRDAQAARDFIREVMYAGLKQRAPGRAFFGAAACATSLLWHAGDRRGALKELRFAHAERGAIPEGRSTDVLLIAAHHRNVLRLVADDEKSADLRQMRQDAIAWVRSGAQSGYGFLVADATLRPFLAAQLPAS